MKAKTLLSAAAVMTALSLIPTSSPNAQATFTINAGTMAPEGTPWAQQFSNLKARIEGGSGGKIKVRAFLGGALGNEVEMVRDCRRGERLQAVGVSTAAMAEGAGVPLLELPELPYLFKTDKEADTVLDEVLRKPVTDALAAKGFTFGFWAENGWRNFGTKGPASTPEELRKYKMRTQESPVHIAMWKALGVTAVPKPTSEVLPALQSGIVDGFDNTSLFALSAGLIDPISHYTLSRHIYQPAIIAYSKRLFDSLPPDLQAVVLGDPLAEAKSGRAGVRALESEMLATIKNVKKKQVVDLTAAQRQVFADLTKVVQTDWVTTNPTLKPTYDAVQAKLKTMR